MDSLICWDVEVGNAVEKLSSERAVSRYLKMLMKIEEYTGKRSRDIYSGGNSKTDGMVYFL